MGLGSSSQHRSPPCVLPTSTRLFTFEQYDLSFVINRVHGRFTGRSNATPSRPLSISNLPAMSSWLLLNGAGRSARAAALLARRTSIESMRNNQKFEDD